MPRPLSTLPKAHLHLHLTGAMRHSTMVELAREHAISLPPALTEDWPPQLSGTDERGWFRFQRLYDVARSVLRRPVDVHRLLREAAEDEAAEGSGWLEIQADPSGFERRFGGITPFLELVLAAAGAAAAATGTGIAVIVAANRTRHPLDARTLARLAAQYAGHGVTGFGLSNDERRGAAGDFAPAFRIAERAGLLLVPHGGELCGPGSVAACLDDLHADRIGHGVHAVEDPALVKRLAAEAVTLEVCPSSNVALGIAAGPEKVPLRQLFEAGVPVALGADDPLLFGPRLTAQYEIARLDHGFSDAELAELARMSVRASAAPPGVRTRLLAGIEAWLSLSDGTSGAPPAAQRTPSRGGRPHAAPALRRCPPPHDARPQTVPALRRCPPSPSAIRYPRSPSPAPVPRDSARPGTRARPQPCYLWGMWRH
ncbi:MAG: adenosine deaminase [Streptosporangiaceae bacterium]|nr:adenosine deaminase [Streptosporangiaceae bacterium]MBV9856067.1 adenosine deaminase [Streptosporangiaceae bacterium]